MESSLKVENQQTFFTKGLSLSLFSITSELGFVARLAGAFVVLKSFLLLPVVAFFGTSATGGGATSLSLSDISYVLIAGLGAESGLLFCSSCIRESKRLSEKIPYV